MTLAILGDKIEGDSWDSIYQNAYANIVTATENGYLKKIWAKIDDPLTIYHFRAVIFKISNGQKVAETAIVPGNGVNNSWQSLALNNEAIIAGEQYAILIVADNAASIFFSSGGSNLAHWGGAPGYMANGFPDPMPIGQTINRTFSLYAEYETFAGSTLTITATGGGTTNPTPGSYSVAAGTSIRVTAIPNANYVLDHWELDGANIGATNPIDVYMDANHALHAVFAATVQNWTLTISAGLGGSVNPLGTITGAQGTTTPTITATPNSGYIFNNWLFDGVSYTNNPISFQINDAAVHTLNAVFTETTTPIHTLTMEPTANGTTDPPAGAYQYAEGTIVTIRAIPDTGYRFDHWVETARGAQYILYDNPLTGAMPDVDLSFLAVFVSEEPPPATFTLTINSQPITGVPVTVERVS